MKKVLVVLSEYGFRGEELVGGSGPIVDMVNDKRLHMVQVLEKGLRRYGR